jgi:proline iminopeptidase
MTKSSRQDHAPIKSPLSGLYAPIEPYTSGRLKVDDVHEIYFEQAGNPKGKPVIFVHGGPGAGIAPSYRQFFNPEKYHIILFDQRGCGRSTPFAHLENNTTWDLVADMEKIRTHLGIEKWQVFGGSWGSTLGLAYSQTHPERVTELVLRGIFLLRKLEIDWFYQEGCSYIYPDAWEHYLKPIPENERHDMVGAYYKRLTSSDARIRLEASKAWSVWEGSTSKLITDDASLARYQGDDFATAFARIECHYFINKGFFKSDDHLLTHIDAIRHIPGVIVQGRYDVVCPMKSAWDLHRAWPEADFQVIPDAGHSANEYGISRALVAATDRFADNW